jgi:hypothetical protein
MSIQTIKDLLQETEKGCNRYNIRWAGKEDIICHIRHLCPECRMKIRTLKQCQTIAEEREKKILDILNKIGDIWEIAEENGCGEFEYSQFKDTAIFKALKQQLNPAQTKGENNGN